MISTGAKHTAHREERGKDGVDDEDECNAALSMSCVQFTHGAAVGARWFVHHKLAIPFISIYSRMARAHTVAYDTFMYTIHSSASK